MATEHYVDPYIAVVTGSEDVATLIERVLKEAIPHIPHRVIATSTRSGAISSARTILAAQRRPTVLVLETHTTNKEAIEELEVTTKSMLALAYSGANYVLQLVVPDIATAQLRNTVVVGNIIEAVTSLDR